MSFSGKGLNQKKLEDYLQLAQRNESLNFIPKNANNLTISKLKKVGGGVRSNVYSFTLAYTFDGVKQVCNLVLKIYEKNIHPILNVDYHDYLICEREFQVLKNLGRIGFPVPQVYLCEKNSSFIGSPFILMLQEKPICKHLVKFDCFANTLACLHNLNVNQLGIEYLRLPKDGFAFAKFWQIHINQLLQSSKHQRKLKKGFDLAASWLDSNASDVYCPRYSLLHGDFHPGNVIMTDKSRLSVIDWEGAEIGDPAFDVGYSYHYVKLFSDEKSLALKEKTADHFVSEYIKNYQGEIRSRLEFYEVVGILRMAIYLSSSISNPITFQKHYGHRALMVFPFVRWPFAAKMAGCEFEMSWLEYFEDFLETKLRK